MLSVLSEEYSTITGKYSLQNIIYFWIWKKMFCPIADYAQAFSWLCTEGPLLAEFWGSKDKTKTQMGYKAGGIPLCYLLNSLNKKMLISENSLVLKMFSLFYESLFNLAKLIVHKANYLLKVDDLLLSC